MGKELSRHKIWEVASQVLSPLDFNADLTKKDAAFNAIKLDHCGMIDEDKSGFVPVYLNTLVDGACVKKDELDKVIEKHLKNNWHTNRISKVDSVILCTATFEITYATDAPAAVVLNEAIKLARTFSDDRSCKFADGILSNVLKELEAGA